VNSSSLAKIGLFSATLIVVANMIGSGIFVTTGWLAPTLPSHLGLLLAWLLGGLLALCGALAYGELAATIPRSGGEYHFLSKIYHPALGFTAGFISLVVGFAAPIALTSVTFGRYTSQVFPLGTGLDSELMGTALILFLTALHSLQLRHGASAQNVFTIVKVVLIVCIIIAGLWSDGQPLTLAWTFQPAGGGELSSIIGLAFALALVQIYYAYSGWNAAVYLADEIENPNRNVPSALVFGTLLVTALYILLTYVFLRHVPLSQMIEHGAEHEVGAMAADAIFGDWGYIVTLIISFALISSVSSMVMAGPRVTQMIGQDFKPFALLARPNRSGVPAYAIALQTGLALLIMWVFDPLTILIYVGFTLSLFAMLSVLGVFILRARYPKLERSYRTWGYPITPALFIGLCAWMIYSSLAENPTAGLTGLSTLVVGFVLYFAFGLHRKS
jgi:APA family basic amino acid/polyamine antiporter